jgi:flagella basal body P-ring formation protein FlgA
MKACLVLKKMVRGQASLFLSLILFSHFFNLAAYSQEVFYLRSRAQIQTQTIKLSQIVVLPKTVSDREIMPAPTGPMTLTPEKLSELLPSDLAHFRILGGKCEILPFNLHFPAKELEESLRKEIIKRNSIDEEDFRLTYMGTDIQMPGEIQLVWENFPRDLGPGSRIFTLSAIKGSSKIYSTRLKFKFEKKVRVAVLRKSVSPFNLLTEKDFIMKTMFLEEPSRDLVVNEPTGMAVLTALEEGTILRKKHIRLVHAVEKGTEVEIFYRTGNITVKAKAIAKQSGNPGETIEVKSKSSGNLLKGVVSSRGQVEIE